MVTSDPLCPLVKLKLPERQLGSTLNKNFSPYLTDGTMFSGTGDKTSVRAFRDSGSSQILGREVCSLLPREKISMSSITGWNMAPVFDVHRTPLFTAA